MLGDVAVIACGIDVFLVIGELAKRPGLTVRTLHHYDAIKLLSPPTRSDAGYRLYNRQHINRQHIERLRRIQALRRLGLSLKVTSTKIRSARN